MKDKITKLYSLHEQIEKLEEEAYQLGLSTFGGAYEGADIMEGVLCVYEDRGHVFESDESFYDKDGEKV